jgi:hypothetical protein
MLKRGGVQPQLHLRGHGKMPVFEYDYAVFRWLP